jgi:1-acyl-sn-glycerol-3-phosphate acyltransferase
MKKLCAQLFFFLSGWKLKVNDYQKYIPSVMIAAPHTSNWDFPYSLAAFWLMGIPVRYFIKDIYTKGPWGYFFRWTGAIGVNRSKKGSGLTEYAISLLKSEKDLVIIVPAEGTRSKVEKWRTGFYTIANEAKVNISLGYLDYKLKEAGILDCFKPSGVFEEDMERIQALYKPIHAKFPEKYNEKIY